ncbi:MAG: flagellar export chaperone FlgN [Lachnospiraceae bacterium]|nr:flagellar export chaperone FlgN [Candidatus Merdinaster equi]
MMDETTRYMKILSDSLDKKIEILKLLLQMNEQQLQIVENGMNQDEFDGILSEKQEQIDLIEKLDTGFDTIYAKVKREITLNPSGHKEEIVLMQEQISLLTDLSVKLKASEARNKRAIEQQLIVMRRNNQTVRKSIDAANVYYRNMTNTQVVDAQIVDYSTK